MKKLLLAILVLLSAGAHAQSWLWARYSACSNTPGNELFYAVMDELSAKKGIYVAGVDNGDSLCLPPYVIHGGHGQARTFLAKYDTSGNLLWAYGDTLGESEVLDIKIDGNGDLFVLARVFTDSIQYRGHSIVNPHYIPGSGFLKNNCYFIMKVDPFGNYLWSKVGGDIGAAAGAGLALDALNNIYVCGSYDSAGLQIESHYYATHNPHHDSDDIFIARYDPAGNFMWCKTYGGAGRDNAVRLVMNGNNQLVMSGNFNSPALPLGSTTLSLSPYHYSTQSVFVAGLDTAGNMIWAMRPLGGGYALGLAVDHSDNIYFSGSMYDTVVSFGPYSIHTQMMYRGSFLAKLDTGGTPMWANYFYPLTHVPYGAMGTRVSNIGIDPCDNVWITGRLVPDSIAMNSTTLLPTALPSSVSDDGLLFAGFNSSGALLQANEYKGGGDDDAPLVFDCRGNLYMGGDGRLTFMLGADTVRSYGGENMFFAKYSPNVGCAGSCDGMTLREEGRGLPEQLALYPNPANTELNIVVPAGISSIAIYDMPGRLLLSRVCHGERETVNVAHLAPGVYFVRVNGSEMRRFLKE